MRIFIVDAFTDTKYKGNSAAVCLLDAEQPDEWMQKVAREMNLPETAFLLKVEDHYSLRWFTPTVEVDLCGHATLASAHILWTEEHESKDTIRFMTQSGVLTATKMNELIQLDFPQEVASECTAPSELIEGLGVPFLFVGKNRMDYIVEVENEDIVKGLSPNFLILKKLEGRGVLVTSKSNRENVDFVSRCFFPASGINEDPVTGSAHCCLAPYWSHRLHKNKFYAMQLSDRQGVLDLELQGDRIMISGKAVTTLRGELI